MWDGMKDGDGGEEDMMEPLCNSMKKLTSMTEQNYEQQMKTPSDVTTTSKSVTSFRKSLVFDTSLTPNDDDDDNDEHYEATTSSNASKSSENQHDHHHSGSGTSGPKARTSLTFNEPAISVRSFYGKPIEKPVGEKHNDALLDKINYAPIAAPVATKQKFESRSMSRSKSRSKPKSLSQRMKAAPSLWRFSGKTKFNHHHKRHRVPHKAPKKMTKSTTTWNDGAANARTDVENVPPANGMEFTSRIEQNLRLQKILKEQPNALSASREINWIGGASGSIVATESSPGFLNSDAEDEEHEEGGGRLAANATYEEIEVDVEEPTNRKFFKSSASNSAKKYRIMGRLSATIKRGGDLKFDPPPKRKKKRNIKGERENKCTSFESNIIY